MNTLDHFLSTRISAIKEAQTWGDIRLQVNTYLSDELPPLEWVTSVRAIVRHGSNIIVVRDPERLHILPGGRRENDESLEQTLRREILEETGCEVGPPCLLGFRHFHHLTARPVDYLYPYPDFLHLIFTVQLVGYSPSARQADGYELSAQFIPLADVKELSISLSEQALLTKAMSCHV